MEDLAAVIISIAALITAIVTIYTTMKKVFTFTKKIDDLIDSVKSVKTEQKIHTSAILACLKGLQEQGCNGPVTKAISDIESHLNEAAHENS